jgi:hypothetical protein
MMWESIAATALVAWFGLGTEIEPALALDCDGKPPKLVNEDGTAHDYWITCARKTERGTITGNASKKLKKKAGCTITVGSNEAVKLRSEMECTIRGGELTCELL